MWPLAYEISPITTGVSFLGARAAYCDEIATVAEPIGASAARSARMRWTGSYRSVQLTQDIPLAQDRETAPVAGAVGLRLLT